MEEEKAETSKAAKSNELAETTPADIPDNVVLRKLLVSWNDMLYVTLQKKNKKAISFESYLTISVEGLALEWDLSVWLFYSEGQDILILQTVVGVHAIIVVNKVI